MYFTRDIDQELSDHFSQEHPTPVVLFGTPDSSKFSVLKNLENSVFKQVLFVDCRRYTIDGPLKLVYDDPEIKDSKDTLVVFYNLISNKSMLETLYNLGTNGHRTAVVFNTVKEMKTIIYHTEGIKVFTVNPLTYQEYLKALEDYKQSHDDFNLTSSDVTNYYKLCGGNPKLLSKAIKGAPIAKSIENYVLNVISDFTKTYNHSTAKVIGVLQAFTNLALAQQAIFTDITFELSEYLDRVCLDFTLEDKELKKILFDLVAYGILRKNIVYDVDSDEIVTKYCVNFKELSFFHYFMAERICSARSKKALESDLLVRAFIGNNKLLLDSGIDFFRCSFTDVQSFNRFSTVTPLPQQETPFYGFHSKDSDDFVFLTFSNSTQERLKELYPNSTVLIVDSALENTADCFVQTAISLFRQKKN